MQKHLVECPTCLGMKEVFDGNRMIACIPCKATGVIESEEYIPEDDELLFMDDENVIPFDDDDFYNEEINGPLS